MSGPLWTALALALSETLLQLLWQLSLLAAGVALLLPPLRQRPAQWRYALCAAALLAGLLLAALQLRANWPGHMAAEADAAVASSAVLPDATPPPFGAWWRTRA